ncbi:hypothetical protein B0J17DRAFT_140736 [Rhizoctonia solani]|nr:hypothetical protein B0J17DRAFT_140736 [Rhizoctonia solani]
MTRSTLRTPMSYSSVLSAEGLVASRMAFCKASSPKQPNLDHIRLYPEAQEVARAILAEMGRPDASYIEMKAVGSNFVCGRCHVTNHMTWEQLIKHYIKHNQLHDSVQKGPSSLANLGITYNNVHNPTLYTNQPIVKYYSSGGAEESDDSECRQACKLCAKIPAVDKVVAFMPAILRHIRDVHDITKPKVNKHYVPRVFGVGRPEMDDCDSYYADSSLSDHFGDHVWGCWSSDDNTVFDDVDYESEYSGLDDEDIDADGGHWFDSEDDGSWPSTDDDW